MFTLYQISTLGLFVAKVPLNLPVDFLNGVNGLAVKMNLIGVHDSERVSQPQVIYLQRVMGRILLSQIANVSFKRLHLRPLQ